MAYETAEDLRVECPEVDLVMFRAYSSGSAHEGPLGYGWTHSYEWRAERAGEIASAGGYAAWVAQRASDPDASSGLTSPCRAADGLCALMSALCP